MKKQERHDAIAPPAMEKSARVKKLFYLAKSQLRESAFQSRLLMVELLLCLLAFPILLGQFSFYRDVENEFNEYPLDTIYSYVVDEPEKMEHFIAYAKTRPEIVLLGVKKEISIREDSDEFVITTPDSISLCVYEKPFFDCMTQKLKRGAGIDTSRTDPVIQVLVSPNLEKRFALGGQYTLHMNYFVPNLEEGPASITIERDFPIEVCGILNSNIAVDSSLVDYTGHTLIGYDGGNLLKDENESKTRQFFLTNTKDASLWAMLEENGTFSSFTENKNYALNNLMETLKVPVILCISLLMLCIGGFLAYMILLSVQKEKQTAIYQMCGATKMDCLAIQVIQYGIILGIPTALAGLTLLVLYYTEVVSSLHFSNFIVSLLLLFLVFVVAAFFSLRQGRKKTTIELLHRWI